tara:strand:+ start:69 stop:728 length:660 start_codon:yes stop_codon:yes gene_type:complete
MSERIRVQGGKLYTRVVDRLTAFKGRFPVGIDGVLIHTEIHTLTDSYVVFKATISEGDVILATGHGFNAIAKEKAFEKAETVAVGRALAFFDPQYGGESELASQEEIEKYEELINDDGSLNPPTQKRNRDLINELEKPLLNGTVDQAMKKMSNGNTGVIKDAVCNFKKYKGMQWSEVALIDTVDDKGKAEIGTDYMKWIKTNVKDLDTDTLEILNQYIG